MEGVGVSWGMRAGRKRRWIYSSGFRVQGSDVRLQELGCRVRVCLWDEGGEEEKVNVRPV